MKKKKQQYDDENNQNFCHKNELQPLELNYVYNTLLLDSFTQIHEQEIVSLTPCNNENMYKMRKSTI